jgi:hypothetical protein
MTSEEQKEIKKEYAKYKRIVTEIAGEIHDIVEDTIWTEYERLLELSEQVQVAMRDVTALKAQYDFLK